MTQLQDYQKTLERELKRGNATEHTYRSTLKTLLESLFPSVVATNEPKRIKAGAPDYVVTKGETPLGYIEAKDIGVSLDKTEKSEQLGRYLDSLGNLILTDYLEFRWYVEGQHRLTAKLASVNGKGLIAEPTGAQDLTMLLQSFMNITAPTIGSPEALAKKMAALAQQIRHTILQAFSAEDLTDDRPDPLHDQYKAFKEVLIQDLTPEQFADMYAQTITYGMFAARTSPNFTPPFDRYRAAYNIPKTNPFLRTVFRQMVGPELESSVDWIVDDLVNLLAHADIGAILEDFGTRTRTEDPVVHFYETFLAAYDPRMREARGVYYTPEPVVSYIVRSVDHILKKDFKLRDGLADTSMVRVVDPERQSSKERKTKDVHKVQILDPATGTATFLHAVIDQIHQTVVGQTGGNRGMWSGYVRNHLLPRLYGFELLMAPYTVAHMKLGLQLAELGYDFGSDERLKIYLTNALEEAQAFPSLPLFGQAIARESQEAGEVKGDAPVMVVLGNPPYSGHSANNGEWIRDLLRGKDNTTGKETEDYFKVDGEPLGERNPKWLNDDYVKFIRFSQWRIEQTGYGVLAFVTNHGYLDNPTFRGMRRSLMSTFDDLYLLDLHGNAKKKETAPDGSPDQNVFDIMQGVSIGLFVKKSGDKKQQRVYKADLYGSREGKYQALWEGDVSTTEWIELKPQRPFYLFSEQDTDLLSEYHRGRRITDIMTTNSVGIVTARDGFAVDIDKDVLESRLRSFCDTRHTDEQIRSTFRLRDTSKFKVAEARKAFCSTTWENDLQANHYRPFDTRWIIYRDELIERSRSDIMQHMIDSDNLAFYTCRQTISDSWRHILASKEVTDDNYVSNKSRERGYLFPLYLYPDSKSPNIFDQPAPNPGGRRPNLAPAFLEDLSKRLGLTFVDDGKGDLATTFGPEDVFGYIYAVFHSPTYRERYAEFLKIDFPRVPLTSKLELFRSLVAKGETLVSLHLMERVGSVMTSYPVEGDNVVDKVSFKEDEGGKTGRVYINSTQYFDGVPLEVWNFYVGGYQVLHKWLKDRKGRTLSFDDLRHYGFIVSALFETIGTMREIDEVVEGAGGWPLE